MAFPRERQQQNHERVYRLQSLPSQILIQQVLVELRVWVFSSHSYPQSELRYGWMKAGLCVQPGST